MLTSSPTARARNRRFWPLRALRAHTKAPYKTDSLWRTLRPLNRPGRAGHSMMIFGLTWFCAGSASCAAQVNAVWLHEAMQDWLTWIFGCSSVQPSFTVGGQPLQSLYAYKKVRSDCPFALPFSHFIPALLKTCDSSVSKTTMSLSACFLKMSMPKIVHYFPQIILFAKNIQLLAANVVRLRLDNHVRSGPFHETTPRCETS